MRIRRHLVCALTVVGVILCGRLAGAQETVREEFFIISSINPAKQQLTVKRPTEVTELMTVTAATRYLDRDGRSIALTDLRAGDTVYVRTSLSNTGPLVVEVRKSPMTVDELRKRYLGRKR